MSYKNKLFENKKPYEFDHELFFKAMKENIIYQYHHFQ